MRVAIANLKDNRCSLLALSGGKKFRQTDAKVDTSVASIPRFLADQQETDQKLQVGVAAESIFRDFRDFLEKIT